MRFHCSCATLARGSGNCEEMSPGYLSTSERTCGSQRSKPAVLVGSVPVATWLFPKEKERQGRHESDHNCDT